MTVKERIKKYAKNKNISIRKFEELSGLSYGYVNGIRVSVQPDKIASIASYFTDLNIDWLMTGKGEMLKDSDQPNENSSTILKQNGYKMVPVYNFDAVGGMNSWNDVIDSPSYIEKYIPFVGAGSGDICVRVTGNSMMPVYSSGSLLLVRRVEGWANYFGYGHCYVLLLKDGRRILKEIQKSESDPKENVLCVSFNPKHPQEELPKNFIVEVYKVIMTLTNEGF